MTDDDKKLSKMCMAASFDDRLADGMLYRKAAEAIERLSGELVEKTTAMENAVAEVGVWARKFGRAEMEISALKKAQGEPVCTKLETQPFSCFHVSCDDMLRLKALPVGTNLYLHPPEDAKDAARYRWLRDNVVEFKPKGYDGGRQGRFDMVWPYPNGNLDAAIDKAMEAK